MDRPVLRGVALGADGSAGERLGLTVADGRSLLGGVVLAWTAEGGGILGLDLEGVPAGGPLPRRTVVTPADVPGTADTAHPVGAVAVDHVVVLTGDVERTLDGLGVPARRVEQRAGRTYAYVVVATSLLEVVGPTEPDDRPAHLWGLALTVADLDAALELLGEGAGPARPAVQPGRRIATVRHETLGLGVPTVLLDPRA